MNRAEKRRQNKLAKKRGRKSTSRITTDVHEQQRLSHQQAINNAVQHYSAGDLPKAEGLCRQILQTDPNHPAALHLLGVIALQSGNYGNAVDLIEKALILNPGNSDAHYNLGAAYSKLKKFDEAVENYHKALAIQPDFGVAHNNLGSALQDLGKLDEAVESFHKALAYDPDNVRAHNNLGNAFKNLGQLDEAVASFRKALAIAPDFAETHYNLGSAFSEMKQLEKAVESYHKSLAIKPGYATAHRNLGNALKKLGRFEDAIRSYDLAHSNFASDDLIETNYCRYKSLECDYLLERYDDFYRKLDELIKVDFVNINVAAFSAFAAQQLDHVDPYPFCKNPMDFVRIYNGLADVEDILESLVGEIQRREAVWEPPGIATIKGFQSASNLFINPTGIFADLDRIIKEKIEVYRSEFSTENCNFIRLMPKTLSIQGWGVRLLKGGHQKEHIHPDGWLSGVFYLKVPEFRNQEEGSIEFGLWGFNYPILDKDYPRKRYYPKSGDFALFPSSLFHRTIPFHSDDERLCIAFDLFPT